MKVGEGQTDFLLLMPIARRSLPRFRMPVPASMMAMRLVSVNELQAGRVAAELLETGITGRDGAAGAVEFEFHTVTFCEGKSPLVGIKMQTIGCAFFLAGGLN